MEAAAIEIETLEVRAGGRCLLEVERWRVDAGMLAAVMGPNGAGKSTLLRACLGLLARARGRVTVLGEDVHALRGGALAGLRRRIGYVPQLPPARGEVSLTVREVVAIGCTARAGWLRPLSRSDWHTVDRWVERLGLEPLADRAFGEISGGEQRKALIARAMAQEPELLLLDEPTAHLDLGWRERIVETIETLYAETRIGVLLVCHELEVLPPACRHVLLLDSGRVLTAGSPEEVFTIERVAALYGAGLQVWHGGGRHAVMPEPGTRQGGAAC